MFDFAQERGEKALSEQDHVRKTADMMLLKELFRELEFEFALELKSNSSSRPMSSCGMRSLQPK